MDTYKKFVVIILSIGVVLGIGFAILLAVKSNNSTDERDNVVFPEPVPEIPSGGGETQEPKSPIFSAFGVVTFRDGEKFTFPDGLSVELAGVSDSRCPEGVECIWQGEISGNFILSGGSLATSSEIRLGTVNNKNIAMGNYVFSMQSATPESITVLVQKN